MEAVEFPPRAQSTPTQRSALMAAVRSGSDIIPIEVLRALPKAELHCHYDGFATPQTIFDLGREQGITKWQDVYELHGHMIVLDDCPDLVTFLNAFGVVNDVLTTSKAIERVAFECGAKAAEDGIRYLELRLAPCLCTSGGMTLLDVMNSYLDGCERAMMMYPIKISSIICGLRCVSPTCNRDMFEVGCWTKRRGVVAVDLAAGPECVDDIPRVQAAGSLFPRNADAFEFARKVLPITIHAGEAAGARSIAEALTIGAERIGHGTRILGDPSVLQEVIDRRIPLEVCLTSNLQTKAIEGLSIDEVVKASSRRSSASSSMSGSDSATFRPDYEDVAEPSEWLELICKHPLRQLYDRGVRVCICQDDPTVCGVTLTHEYAMLQGAFRFTSGDILKIIDYGFRSAFVCTKTKRVMRRDALLRSLKIFRDAQVRLDGFDEDYFAPLFEEFQAPVPLEVAHGLQLPFIGLPALKLEDVGELGKPPYGYAEIVLPQAQAAEAREACPPSCNIIARADATESTRSSAKVGLDCARLGPSEIIESLYRTRATRIRNATQMVEDEAVVEFVARREIFVLVTFEEVHAKTQAVQRLLDSCVKLALVGRGDAADYIRVARVLKKDGRFIVRLASDGLASAQIPYAGCHRMQKELWYQWKAWLAEHKIPLVRVGLPEEPADK